MRSACCALGLAMTACVGRDVAPAARSPLPRVDHLVLVTVDTLRADHLGCYGYPRPTSPFVDSLARDGVVFRKAFASMSTTAPSHASIFTSLHPLQHRLLQNGHRLDDRFLTLAEMIKPLGFATAAFLGVPYPFRAGNLRQGFDVFDEGAGRRPADVVVDAAARWLAARQPADRFLLWVHLYEPHQPLEPPAKLVRAFADQPEPGRSTMARFLIETQHVDFDFYGRDAAKLLETIDAYDAAVLFSDQQLGRLDNQLRKRGLDANVLWIFTADHGEGLGNHGWLEHGRHIYNEQVRVPLILRFSGGRFHGLAVDHVVEHVDLLPTVAELIGFDVQRQVAPVQGVSLVPLLPGSGRGFPTKSAFSQRRSFSERNRPPHAGSEDSMYEAGEKYSLQDRRYKWILKTEGRSELYDLEEDPYEVKNLEGIGGANESRLKEALVRRVRELKATARGAPQLGDPESIERLKALGYVQ